MQIENDELKIKKIIYEARKCFNAILKDGTNPHFKSKYVTLDNILKTIEGPFEQHGLFLSNSFLNIEGNSFLVVTITHLETGVYLKSEIPLLLAKNEMQQLGSAITYARRYALSAMLNITIDEDDDGNATSSYQPKQNNKKTNNQSYNQSTQSNDNYRYTINDIKWHKEINMGTKRIIKSDNIEEVKKESRKKTDDRTAVGRRRLLASEQQRRICVGFRKDFYDKLEKSARRAGRSIGGQIAYLSDIGLTYEQYVKNSGLPIPTDELAQNLAGLQKKIVSFEI